MPLVLQKNIHPNTTLVVWQITESSQDLLYLIGNNYFEDNHHQKINQANARHYLASRLALTSLFVGHQIKLTKNQNNKPSLIIDGITHKISITHSFDYAAILVNNSHELGIDIERIDPRIARVKSKFMNENEMKFAGEVNQIKMQTLIWSCKETLYKLYSNREVDFRKNLHILPFTLQEKGTLETAIVLGGLNQKIIVHYEEMDNYMLTYTTDQIILL
jgi:phosphopantetheinyl transferase (holo-ACP synthase)